MNRNYHVLSIIETTEDIPDYSKIMVDHISKIINHSADKIICTCLEYQDKTKISTTINDMLNKIRPQGQINIVFTNFKQVFHDFLNSKIDASTVFSLLRGKANMLVAEDILTMIDLNLYRIINHTTTDNYTTSIVIERIAI